MRNWAIAGLAMLALAGCSRHGGGPGRPVPVEGDSISYETGPCFGACPVYAFTIRPDGSGTFTGKRFTAVLGERSFQARPEQYRAFAAALAPYRPATGAVRYAQGEPLCGQVVTDMPSVEVTWRRAVGDSQNLYYYYGCDRRKNQAMADALGNAPDALPQLTPLIGERP